MNKDQLLHAAEQLLVEWGYEGFQLEMIVDHLSKRTASELETFING